MPDSSAAYDAKHAGYFAHQRRDIAPLLPCAPGQKLGQIGRAHV